MERLPKSRAEGNTRNMTEKEILEAITMESVIVSRGPDGLQEPVSLVRRDFSPEKLAAFLHKHLTK